MATKTKTSEVGVCRAIQIAADGSAKVSTLLSVMDAAYSSQDSFGDADPGKVAIRLLASIKPHYEAAREAWLTTP